MSQLLRRVLYVTSSVLLLALLSTVLWTSYRAVVLAQTQSYTDFAIGELSRRLTQLENDRISTSADARLRVLESNMADIRKAQEESNLWIRSVAAAVLAQLTFAGLGLLRKSKATP